MRNRKIKEHNINIGEPVKESLVDDDGKLMLQKGFTFTDARQMKILSSLEIDNSIGNKEATKEPDKHEAETTDDSPFDLIDFSLLQLDNYFQNLNTIKDFDHKVQTIAKTIQRVCIEDEDLSIGTVFMSHNTKYSIRHALQTAIVSEIMSKALGWNQPTRLSLVCAAITMNIAMMDLQDVLLSQKEELTDIQHKTVRLHPQQGVDILTKLGVKNELWLDTVYQHHEAADGSGYPFGLKKNSISQSAQIIKMADIYCARVSGRNYRPPLLPDTAIRQIFVEGERISDVELANIFVKNLGIYPPGSYVKLRNNELSIVTQRGKKVYSPIAHSIVRSNGYRAIIPIKRDTSETQFSIVEIIQPQNINVSVNRHQLWGYGVFKRQRTTKRKENRYQTNLPAIILHIEEKNITTAEAFIINISTSGCMLKIAKDKFKGYQLNTNYYLTFRLIDRTLEDIVFKIKNISETYDYLLLGCQLLDLSPERTLFINNFIKEVSNNGYQE